MKKEAFEFYKDKIEDRIQDLMETIDIMDGKLQKEILEKESEYDKGVSIIERRLEVIQFFWEQGLSEFFQLYQLAI